MNDGILTQAPPPTLLNLVLLPSLLGAAVGGVARGNAKGAALGAGIGLGITLVLSFASAARPGPQGSGVQERNAVTDYLIATGPGGV